MNLKISKSFYKKPIWWIQFIIVFNCIYKVMINFFHAPSGINYLNDLAWTFLALSILVNKKRNSSTKKADILIILLFAETILGYVLNFYQPIIYVWGFRTLFRYFVFFKACTLYANKDLFVRVLNLFKIMIFLNVLFATFEMFLGYKMDAITGLYSAGKNVIGGSAGLNILMCIVCTNVIIQYLYKKISLLRMSLFIIPCMYMAAIGELKAFYFEFVLIIVLSVLVTNYSLKKLIVIIAGVGLFCIGLTLYNKFYGVKNDIFSINEMMSYSGIDGSTYGQYLLNRTTALPYIKNNLLNTPLKFLLGLGLGYCDTVSFPLFSSGFIDKYGYLGYQFFFSSIEFLNIGAIGLAIYYLFIVSIFVFSRKQMKRSISDDNHLYALVQVTCILVFFISFYNQSLLIDVAAFNVFFVLAIPYAISITNGKNVKRNHALVVDLRTDS